MPNARNVSALEQMIVKLRRLTERIASAERLNDPRAAKRAKTALDAVTRQLAHVAENLDPILRPETIFDPTDPTTAGRIVALTLVAQEKHPLSLVPSFYGAGVYAIYYGGNFEPYAALSGTDHPIYVGKADPSNPAAHDAEGQGTKLSSRLIEHAKSIRKATSTLSVEDFSCRFLIVQSGFQKSAEDYLIGFFEPIWNSETKICFGLGKHGDSSATRANDRSPWDTMHPGRSWAATTAKDQKPRELIIEQINVHLRGKPPYRDIHEIFERFTADLLQISPDRFSLPGAGSLDHPDTPDEAEG